MEAGSILNAAAVGQVEDAGVSVQVKEVSSDDYDAGLIIMQVPDAGETVRKGSDVVQLLVSTGARKMEMPLLAGIASSDAVATLKSMGISMITLERNVSSDFALDTVISSVPEPGMQVDKDSEVTLYISGGSVVCPLLLGLTLAEAEEVVTDSQLTLNPLLNYVDTEDDLQHGLIAQQTPEADSRVVLSSPVTLSLYRCLPDVRSEVLEVSVPPNEENTDVTVKVTFQAEDSTYEWTYTTFICVADSLNRDYLVTIEFPDNRNYICVVYTDGALLQRYEF